MSSIHRRAFLLSSAAAAGAALSQAQDAKVGTAMIGTGGRGTGVLRGILQQPAAKVVALCDLKPDRLDNAATVAAKDNPKTLTEWRKILDMKEVEAVFVTVPPHLHAEMSVAALEAGKHVYCEKPIGVTAEQVQLIVNAAKKSNKVFTTGQQLRSHARLQEAVGKIHRGEVGDLLMVKAQRHANRDHPADSSSADWYFDVEKSGGYLIEQSVHNLDICNWVIGSRPVSAAGYGSTALYKNQPPGRNIFDNASLAYHYGNGVEMSFTQNTFHARGMPGGGQYVHVFTSQASVDLMYATLAYPLTGEGEPRVLSPEREVDPHAHTAAFYAAIRNGGPNPADYRVGAEAALTAILGHEAMVRRKTVSWNDLGVEL